MNVLDTSAQIDQIRREQLLENEAKQAWLQNYVAVHPMPVLIYDQSLGKEQWERAKWTWYAVTASAAAYISYRTGFGIHLTNVAEGINKYWSAIITFPGVVTVEGFIAAYGFQRPRKIHAKWWQNLPEKILWGSSVLIAVAISAGAGMKFSVNAAAALAQQLDEPVSRVMAWLMGIGMTIILTGVTEFAGKQRWTYLNGEAIAQRDHEIAMNEWRINAEKAWRRSDVYLAVAADRKLHERTLKAKLAGATKLEKAKIQAQIEALEAGNVEIVSPLSSGSAQPNRTNPPVRTGPTKTSQIHDYLDELEREGYDINTVTIPIIQQWFQDTYNGTVAKATVSEARSKWTSKAPISEGEIDPFVEVIGDNGTPT
jgi:hypothetical protein